MNFLINNYSTVFFENVKGLAFFLVLIFAVILLHRFHKASN